MDRYEQLANDMPIPGSEEILRLALKGLRRVPGWFSFKENHICIDGYAEITKEEHDAILEVFKPFWDACNEVYKNWEREDLPKIRPDLFDAKGNRI